MDVGGVLDDLVAEQAALDQVVAALPDQAWSVATPSPGWTVADQIGHLAFFDLAAATAIAEPDLFAQQRAELVDTLTTGGDIDEMVLGGFRRLKPADQLEHWRSARAMLATAAKGLAEDARVEWYGPSMGAKSFLTARLMEVWAHGLDVCDAAGTTRTPTDRIRHIAQLGVITRGWSYAVRGDTMPDVPVRVTLTAPSGTEWAWGDAEATETISGDAIDFCAVVTQRRHVDDTDLLVSDGAARDWMLIAQAFAGGPTTGPTPKRAS